MTDYFRGIVKTGEKSQRVLDLTESVIRLNPAHYSAWCVELIALIATHDGEMDLALLLTLCDQAIPIRDPCRSGVPPRC